jgi:WhiB family redox-sensing transcriptional regulator
MCSAVTDKGLPVYDPEMWFPIGEGPAAQQQATNAIAVCNSCPVRERCLESALKSRQDAGVWGGRSEAERRTILRRRSRGQADPEPKPLEPRTHRSVYDQYIRPTTNGHAERRGNTTAAVSLGGERFTLAGLSFFLHHDRHAVGKVSAYCGTYGCLAGSHLGDSIIRAERDAAAAAAKQSPEEAARFWVNSGHAPIGHKPRKVTPAEIDQIHARTLAGEPLEDLAHEYGVHANTIRNYAA